MSIQALSWCLNLRGVSPVAKLAAIALSDTHEVDENNGYPIWQLAEFCGADEIEVETALDELASTGVVCRLENGIVTAEFPVTLSRMSGKAPVQKRLLYIYVVAAPSRTKIGISWNANVRMANLQAWAPETLTLVWTGSGPRSQIMDVERTAHAHLASWRLAGEWFDVTPERAVEVVQGIMKARGLLP